MINEQIGDDAAVYGISLICSRTMYQDSEDSEHERMRRERTSVLYCATASNQIFGQKTLGSLDPNVLQFIFHDEEIQFVSRHTSLTWEENRQVVSPEIANNDERSKGKRVHSGPRRHGLAFSRSSFCSAQLPSNVSLPLDSRTYHVQTHD